jgi:hypothetical protein
MDLEQCQRGTLLGQIYDQKEELARQAKALKTKLAEYGKLKEEMLSVRLNSVPVNEYNELQLKYVLFLNIKI